MPKYDALFANMSSVRSKTIQYLSEYIWTSRTTSLVLGIGALPTNWTPPRPPPHCAPLTPPTPSHPTPCSHSRPRFQGWDRTWGQRRGAGRRRARSFLRLRYCLPFVWLPPLSPWLLIISIFLVFQTNKCHYQAVGSSRRLQALPLGLN